MQRISLISLLALVIPACAIEDVDHFQGTDVSSSSAEPCSSEGCEPTESSEEGGQSVPDLDIDANIEPKALTQYCTGDTFSCQCDQNPDCGCGPFEDEPICAPDDDPPGWWGACPNGIKRCDCERSPGQDGWYRISSNPDRFICLGSLVNCEQSVNGNWVGWQPCGGDCCP